MGSKWEAILTTLSLPTVINLQRAVEESATALGDVCTGTFVSLPAGYGKSGIYGILPHLFDKLNGKNNNRTPAIV